jgi:hypothetical protein
LAALVLRRRPASIDLPSLTRLGIRNTSRRRGRSLATIALLACGAFLVAAIGVFRLDAVRDADRRSSGTGGFSLIGESALPVAADLNSAAGLELFALDEAELRGVSVVPFRVKEGDEASCLNLNRAQQPRLLGVRSSMLADRGAFTFARVMKGMKKSEGWNLLKSYRADGDIPEVAAIGDLNSILWAMGRKVGDALTYTDERGATFRVRIVGAIANSVLQGSLVIDEAAFVERFPSEAGYRMFLVDAPSNESERVAARLMRGLRTLGLELVPAAERLAMFNAVQNTYLGTFQVLGGFGLILGSLGLGVLLLRTVLERRAELAVMMALGFRGRQVRWMVLSEHAGLLAAGLLIGVVTAAVAVLPTAASSGTAPPYASLGLTLAAVALVGFICTWLAARYALRGSLLAALRNE